MAQEIILKTEKPQANGLGIKPKNKEVFYYQIALGVCFIAIVVLFLNSKQSLKQYSIYLLFALGAALFLYNLYMQKMPKINVFEASKATAKLFREHAGRVLDYTRIVGWPDGSGNGYYIQYHEQNRQGTPLTIWWQNGIPIGINNLPLYEVTKESDKNSLIKDYLRTEQLKEKANEILREKGILVQDEPE